MTESKLSRQYAPEPSSCCNPWGKKRTKTSDGNFSSLAQELNELSFEEREKVFDDVHGVAQIQEETPDFVQGCIEAMDKCLEGMTAKKKKAYIRALFLWPKLETDNDFKLMFLRSDHFKPDKAATRMVKHFEAKRDLFGEQYLVSPISMKDLKEEDQSVFLAGCLVELPVKDRTGRPLFYIDSSKMNFDNMSVDSLARCFWFQIMSAMEDETAQKKGTCIIMNYTENPLKNAAIMAKFTELAMKTGPLFTGCLPGRFASLHFCYNDPRMKVFTSTLLLSLSLDERLRFRTHFGSDVEIEYSLMTFGIHCHGLFQGSRKGDTSLHRAYVRRQIELSRNNAKEELQKAIESSFVLYPNASDVLLGRGRPYREFPGNTPWNDLIQDNIYRYRDSASRFEKTCISVELAKTVRDSSTIRLVLERTSEGWKVLDDVTVREKAASALHNRTKNMPRMEIPKTLATGKPPGAAAVDNKLHERDQTHAKTMQPVALV